MNDCLFCKIVSGELPSNKIYENDDVVAILDIHPVAPGHTLIIPKKHSAGSHDAEPSVLKHLIVAAQKVARALVKGLPTEAYNITQHNGEAAGQVIPHLHFHVFPRSKADGLESWSVKPYAEGEMTIVQQKIVKEL